MEAAYGWSSGQVSLRTGMPWLGAPDWSAAPQLVHRGVQVLRPGASIAAGGQLGRAVLHHGLDGRRAQRAPDGAHQGFVADVAGRRIHWR